MNKPSRPAERQSEFLHLWGMPILLGLLTAFGLLAALLGQGVWHWLAWLAIATPIVVMAYHLCKREAGVGRRG
ncbi:hypothetical protein J8I26_14795 [Herbaspirillum sp. LeCh32-8]|uniref:hypothetical protein n=1 Tax=Herbaspirillum sp. LeCh32-8 TaxID=2821356 RepID=UPI001AEA1ABE|nr:hypothetical protein [Herbaspirillum sp. LeCh32-8]MBP0599382.1 hypothetical protein [Herbaspirillum sp. LeCh32-8]